jgi:hypothetical protein
MAHAAPGSVAPRPCSYRTPSYCPPWWQDAITNCSTVGTLCNSILEWFTKDNPFFETGPHVEPIGTMCIPLNDGSGCKHVLLPKPGQDVFLDDLEKWFNDLCNNNPDISLWCQDIKSRSSSITEVCGDGIDNDKDGLVDEDCTPLPTEDCNGGTFVPWVYLGGTSFMSPYTPVCASGQTVTSLYVIAEGCYSLSWTQVLGPPVALSDPTSLNPTFIAPVVSSPTTLVFLLTFSLCGGTTGTTTYTVNVIPA